MRHRSILDAGKTGSISRKEARSAALAAKTAQTASSPPNASRKHTLSGSRFLGQFGDTGSHHVKRSSRPSTQARAKRQGSKDTNFDGTVLPRLAATYEAGRLVPFIGSGMSLPACTNWWTFVHRLENEAAGKTLDAPTTDTSREELIRRANNAVRALKAEKPGAFAIAVRKALVAGHAEPAIPEQTLALSKLWWPLVLSTNYDNCYAAGFCQHFPDRHLAVVGRGVEDCQRVLNSLSVAGRALLWTLQGYLGNPLNVSSAVTAQDLSRQLVVGHEEYRRVTFRDLHFRRAFAEVFRQRSLLFLGAGIQETYLQELFGEVLEYYGPGTRPHYAFIEKGQVDKEFMLDRFQIMVVEYTKGAHEKVVQRLDKLAGAVRQPSRAPVSWSWGRIKPDEENDWTSVPDLEVTRGPLPTCRSEGECLAVSAGGKGGEGSAFFFNPRIEEVMKKWKVEEIPGRPRRLPPYLAEYADKHVYAVRARTESDERSLSHVHDASLALFKHVGKRYRCIHMQLLATGGTDKHDASQARWKMRTYPERFSFIQTVRAWAKWRDRRPNLGCRLALHVVLDSVYQDIASGRIDVLELLSCKDIRFFVEVVSETGEIERRLLQMMPETKLGEVVGYLRLSPDHWTVELTPPPSLKKPSESLREGLDLTLLQLGVIPGSTLHFRRVKARHRSLKKPLPRRRERRR